MPFCMQATEQSPSHRDLQRFCSVAQASSSSHWQRSLAPSLQRSTLIVQRGTSTEFAAGPTDGVAEAGKQVAPTDRSIMTIAISKTPCREGERGRRLTLCRVITTRPSQGGVSAENAVNRRRKSETAARGRVGTTGSVALTLSVRKRI